MTAPTVSRLSTAGLADFLVTQGLAAPAGDASLNKPGALPYESGKLPTLPKRAYFIAATGGPGLILERGLDVQSFQIRTRGLPAIGENAQLGTTDAEQLAWAVDDLLMNTPAGVIGGAYVNLIDRVGAPPTWDRRDPSGSVHYTANYLFTVARITT